jgi:hypothetical protein
MIKVLQKAEHKIMLMLYANEKLVEGQALDAFAKSLKLHDIQANDPAASTFIGKDDSRLDYMFGCADVHKATAQQGTLVYSVGLPLDHRGLFVDLDNADMLSLTVKDIGALAKGFAKRIVAQGKIVFGLRHTNHLKAAINWAQDFQRISRAVTLDPTVTDMAEFRIQIETAKQRALIRDNSDIDGRLTKAADPGKLKQQKEGNP